MRHGFSLVELSIVLVILGLLTGGILAGQSLVRASELLLQERSTRDVPITYARREELARESIRTVVTF